MAATTTILSSAAPTPLTAPPRARARAPAARRRRLRARDILGAALGLANGGASAALAAPLSYEETLRLSTDSGGGGGGGGGGEFALPDLGLGGVLDFVAQNPLAAAAGVAAVALPLVLAQVLGGASKPYGVVSAAAAYRALVEEPGAQLVDIRPPGDARQSGAPDLREAKKKAAAVPYDGEDKNGFLKKLSLRFKDPENTTLVILDNLDIMQTRFDGNSELVAELVTANGYKAAFAVKDGAEGRRGWLDGTDGLPVTLGLAAATGLGILAYTEIETVLQFLGSAAIVQLVASKLIYAEDRKRTLKQIDDFFNKKVAPKELVDEIKEIGQALLPSTGTKSQPAITEAAPATAEAAPAAATATAAPPAAPVEETSTEAAPAEPTPLSPYTNYPDLKPPSSPSPLAPAEATKNESESESAATESAPAVNSAPVAEAAPEAAPPAAPRPLSPYPNYPDLKPPSSPSPSAP
ncbi:Os02g0257300 [Oryza sativa Japonica Group]|uniref:Protein THYLAKOID RHODANESE-LIKE, chloroplastic n=1 Tax=Oryza sativa subsp. japonica TaxID=39947 RepID=A0A0P0VH79_ORYSJ|nr:Os02g0257300 [Oryza sativa Japonica Group]